ncbi:MAG: TIGR04255 family protein [Treponemataceae bacterium]
MKYGNPPVVEVVFGLNFDFTKLSPRQMFDISVLFSKDFPREEVVPITLIPNIEDKSSYSKQGVLGNIEDYGFAMIRKKTKNNDWLIQFQQNRFYFNWIRNNDLKEKSNYAGFNEAFKKFNDTINKINKSLNVELTEKVKYLELSYLDVFSFEKTSEDISGLISFSLPSVLAKDAEFTNSYSHNENRINGKCFMSMSSQNLVDKTFRNVEKKVVVNINLIGKMDSLSFDKWFTTAHDIQNEMFNKIFTNQAKEGWKYD